MAKITISYRRDDSMDITGRIFDRLTSRYGRETVFRDIDSIPPGLDFREHIQASIEDSDVLMVVVAAADTASPESTPRPIMSVSRSRLRSIGTSPSSRYWSAELICRSQASFQKISVNLPIAMPCRSIQGATSTIT